MGEQRQLTEAEYRRIPNGCVLKTLPTGLSILRRTKHEWTIDLEGLNRKDLATVTNPRRGSKFLNSWTLTQYVRYIERRAAQLDWTRETARALHTFTESNPVGYSRGRLV